MKILTTKLWLAVALLSMGILRAAQAPVQEPIPEIQWRQAGCAFLPGLYEKAGANSLVKQLPPDVAKDIVMLAKPKEEYGFIKNYTDKHIDFLSFHDFGVKYLPVVLKPKNRLAPHHEVRFIVPANELDRFLGDHSIIDIDVGIHWWLSVDRLFDVNIRLSDEPRLFVKNVLFSELMNIEVYKEENGHVKLKITAPDHDPVSYYSEPLVAR